MQRRTLSLPFALQWSFAASSDADSSFRVLYDWSHTPVRRTDYRPGRIDTKIQPELRLYADETLLIRMWMNLLNNAVNYGKESGHIWITLQAEKDKIYGEVKDDGIGISTKDLPHIWERFYQADKSRTDAESSGLGLAMVQWIIKEHGGEIYVDSVLGQGSRFYFMIPCE